MNYTLFNFLLFLNYNGFELLSPWYNIKTFRISYKTFNF